MIVKEKVIWWNLPGEWWLSVIQQLWKSAKRSFSQNHDTCHKRLFQPVIYAKDPDLPPYSYPYGFIHCNACQCDGRPSCQDFGLRENIGENTVNLCLTTTA